MSDSHPKLTSEVDPLRGEGPAWMRDAIRPKLRLPGSDGVLAAVAVSSQVTRPAILGGSSNRPLGEVIRRHTKARRGAARLDGIPALSTGVGLFVFFLTMACATISAAAQRDLSVRAIT
jgi:hypothetical protein